MKLSVIVPIFNGERFLSRCLDSLLDQRLEADDYEIICVNDGSTDRTSEILADYSCRYSSFIRVINQENQGVVAARNLGLDEARGEIVTCCDCDDYLVPNAYRYLIDTFWDDSIDVLRFHSVTLDRYVLRNWKENYDVRGEILFDGNGREVFQHPFFASLCTHLYRRSYLNSHNLRLPKMIMDEDRVFNLHLYLSNPHVRACSSCVYRYTVNQCQTTTKRNPERMKLMLPDFIKEFRLCNRYMDECEESEQSLKDYLGKRRFFRTSAFFSRMLSAKLSKKEWSNYIAELKSIGWIPLPYGGKTALVIGLISKSYVFYTASSWLFRSFFEPYILPLVPRN